MSISVLENGKLIPVAGELYRGSGTASFAGQISMGASVVTPEGWLKCDGAAYNKADFEDLYRAIGDTYNKPGTLADQFCVPDMQGRYAMGASATEGVGTSIDEQLPNAKGTLYFSSLYTSAYSVLSSGSGTCSEKYPSGVGDLASSPGGGGYTKWAVDIDASKTQDTDGHRINNPAYKDPVDGVPVKVRPDTIVFNYYIKY